MDAEAGVFTPISKKKKSREELYAEFSEIYKTNWSWQIRKLGQPRVYLVKFPPRLKVDQVIGYLRFGLSKKGIWVKLEAWNETLSMWKCSRKLVSKLGYLCLWSSARC
jgi:hypothetical protein